MSIYFSRSNKKSYTNPRDDRLKRGEPELSKTTASQTQSWKPELKSTAEQVEYRGDNGSESERASEFRDERWGLSQNERDERSSKLKH